MSDFDIRAAIRNVVEESNLSDPGDIAAKVIDQIPGRDLRAVLTVVLREYVRTQLHSFERWRAPDPEPVKANRSAKVAAVRAWARMLRKPVAVEDNIWKQFGDCGVEDLLFLAEDRRRNAAESIAAAERFEKYVAAVEESGVDTVAELPDAVIASIEDGDA